MEGIGSVIYKLCTIGESPYTQHQKAAGDSRARQPRAAPRNVDQDRNSCERSPDNPYGSADFVALKAACSLASSSCESEVIKILPPTPFSSSSTRSLSGVGLLVRTKSVDLLGISTVANSFMKRSVIPTSVSAPEAAPAVAFSKIRLASDPQKAAPSVNKLPARCSLALPDPSFTATTTSARSSRPSLSSFCSLRRTSSA